MRTISSQTIEFGSTEISRVTVFPDRAEIRRKIQLKIEPGINEITINNISGKILEDSIRISGTGMAVIHEIEITWKSVSAKVGPEEIINSTSKEQEKSTLVVDRSTLDGFKELLQFYGQQGIEFGEQDQVLTIEEEECKEKLKEARENLNKLLKEERIRIIKVFLETEKAHEVDLLLSYQVEQAKWRPTYDIRVDSMGEDGSKMNVSYFGRVTQESGEEWANCELVLSTAIPSFGGSLPKLKTLDVSLREKRPVYDDREMYSAPRPQWRSIQPQGSRTALRSNADDPMIDDDEWMPEMAQITATVKEQTLASEFTIARLVTIPSNNGEHKVTIGVAQLVPNLFRECIPMKNFNVFLTASTTNNSSLAFLPGEAAIFFDGNFINKIQLKSVSPGEHFSTSLGIDPSIKVQLMPSHNRQGETGIISKWNTTVKKQKYVVKNNRKEAVMITIYEQIPRSSNERVVVKLLAPDSKTALVTIRSDGIVTMPTVYYVEIACPITVDTFPFDVQACQIPILSFLYTPDDVLTNGTVSPAALSLDGVDFKLVGMFWSPNIRKEQLTKLSIGLTSLVSMTVLLDLLSTAIPKTRVFPLLGIYVVVCVGIISAACVVIVMFALQNPRKKNDWELKKEAHERAMEGYREKFCRFFKEHCTGRHVFFQLCFQGINLAGFIVFLSFWK
ncbi:unnamed protein product, partial [Mesorhabditis belari]|uniref:DUF4139 domain-containing protein n=1 Tax=Mesorhabditis belari TaxID=2138241 RepID=A0AAF3FIS6_9BILA